MRTFSSTLYLAAIIWQSLCWHVSSFLLNTPSSDQFRFRTELPMASSRSASANNNDDDDDDAFDSILQANQQWKSRQLNNDPRYFDKAKRQDSPKYLWIGSVEMTLPAHDIMGQDAADVLVYRNVANIVSATDASLLAVLEQAMSAGVRAIIVCGHYGCDSLRAESSKEAAQWSPLSSWLSSAQGIQRFYQTELGSIAHPEQRHRRLIEVHAMEQCRNLYKLTGMLGNRDLRVHAWVFDETTGDLKLLSLEPSTQTINTVPRATATVQQKKEPMLKAVIAEKFKQSVAAADKVMNRASTTSTAPTRQVGQEMAKNAMPNAPSKASETNPELKDSNVGTTAKDDERNAESETKQSAVPSESRPFYAERGKRPFADSSNKPAVVKAKQADPPAETTESVDSLDDMEDVGDEWGLGSDTENFDESFGDFRDNSAPLEDLEDYAPFQDAYRSPPEIEPRARSRRPAPDVASNDESSSWWGKTFVVNKDQVQTYVKVREAGEDEDEYYDEYVPDERDSRQEPRRPADTRNSGARGPVADPSQESTDAWWDKGDVFNKDQVQTYIKQPQRDSEAHRVKYEEFGGFDEGYDYREPMDDFRPPPEDYEWRMYAPRDGDFEPPMFDEDYSDGREQQFPPRRDERQKPTGVDLTGSDGPDSWWEKGRLYNDDQVQTYIKKKKTPDEPA